jgi:hypothetical protein
MSVNKCLCGPAVSVMVYADVRSLVQFVLEAINFYNVGYSYTAVCIIL